MVVPQGCEKQKPNYPGFCVGFCTQNPTWVFAIFAILQPKSIVDGSDRYCMFP